MKDNSSHSQSPISTVIDSLKDFIIGLWFLTIAVGSFVCGIGATGYSGYFVWNWAYYSTESKLGSFIAFLIATPACIISALIVAFIALIGINGILDEIKINERKVPDETKQENPKGKA